MANKDRKDRKTDDAGIRLAPTPIKRDGENRLPSVRQDLVLRPVLDVEEPDSSASGNEPSTADDFQPKRKDVDKRWKRGKRSKNIVCGFIMFVFSALVVLPYILGTVNVKVDFIPFKYVPSQYNALANLVDGFKTLSSLGWSGDAATAIWKSMLPDYILAFGLLFIAVNLLKSLTGIFGAVKIRKYLISSIIYLLTIVAVLIAALVGAENFGIEKIDFVEDVIHGWQTSDFVGLAILAFANVLAATFCTLINPERSGYTK